MYFFLGFLLIISGGVAIVECALNFKEKYNQKYAMAVFLILLATFCIDYMLEFPPKYVLGDCK